MYPSFENGFNFYDNWQVVGLDSLNIHVIYDKRKRNVKYVFQLSIDQVHSLKNAFIQWTARTSTRLKIKIIIDNIDTFVNLIRWYIWINVNLYKSIVVIIN